MTRQFGQLHLKFTPACRYLFGNSGFDLVLEGTGWTQDQPITFTHTVSAGTLDWEADPGPPLTINELTIAGGRSHKADTSHIIRTDGWNDHATMAINHIEKPPVDDPDICLIRVAPFSDDVFEKWYSRSIRFNDKTPGKLTIEVDVFNNSISRAGEVTCEFFEGKPTLAQGEPKKLEPPKDLLGHATRPDLGPRARATLRLTVPLPGNMPCYITVRVSCTVPPKKKTYWTIYPPDKLAAVRSVEQG
jgi:hypothetical protein